MLWLPGAVENGAHKREHPVWVGENTPLPPNNARAPANTRAWAEGKAGGAVDLGSGANNIKHFLDPPISLMGELGDPSSAYGAALIAGPFPERSSENVGIPQYSPPRAKTPRIAARDPAAPTWVPTDFPPFPPSHSPTRVPLLPVAMAE
ncbi:hypothetical protein BX600DRAFT_510711 [Xylariales sp. PMI_506]|nr:hypothetical protein BX600DRAFT_510711 [Xylariales sp. PMI_506]